VPVRRRKTDGRRIDTLAAPCGDLRVVGALDTGAQQVHELAATAQGVPGTRGGVEVFQALDQCRDLALLNAADVFEEAALEVEVAHAVHRHVHQEVRGEDGEEQLVLDADAHGLVCMARAGRKGYYTPKLPGGENPPQASILFPQTRP